MFFMCPHLILKKKSSLNINSKVKCLYTLFIMYICFKRKRLKHLFFHSAHWNVTVHELWASGVKNLFFNTAKQYGLIEIRTDRLLKSIALEANILTAMIVFRRETCQLSPLLYKDTNQCKRMYIFFAVLNVHFKNQVFFLCFSSFLIKRCMLLNSDRQP